MKAGPTVDVTAANWVVKMVVLTAVRLAVLRVAYSAAMWVVYSVVPTVAQWVVLKAAL